MNICILFDTIDSPTGGGNQFLKALIGELVRTGHQVTARPTSDTEVVLLNGFNYASGRRLRVRHVAELRQSGKMGLLGRILPLSYFETRSRRGPVLVHRVDGVPELARGRRTASDNVQQAVNRLADHTIFQSEFCRTSLVQQGARTPEKWCVINNGVDPSVFFPAEERPIRSGSIRFVAASWSPNRRKGFATLADLSRLPGVHVTFAGNWCPEIEPENVELAGVLSSTSLARLMRTAHAVIHAGWNDACSNAIIEGLACGLPVVFRDSGGNGELVGDCGVTLADDLEETVNTLIERYELLAHRVESQRGRFLVEQSARKYVAVFQAAVSARR